MRVNCWLPDDLAEKVRTDLPDTNVSAVLQEALRQRLECDHEHLTCVRCGDEVERSTVADGALGRFWSDLLGAWEPLVDRHGTAEGAARVAKQVAMEAGVPAADRIPLPRPPRAMREAS